MTDWEFNQVQLNTIPAYLLPVMFVHSSCTCVLVILHAVSRLILANHISVTVSSGFVFFIQPISNKVYPNVHMFVIYLWLDNPNPSFHSRQCYFVTTIIIITVLFNEVILISLLIWSNKTTWPVIMHQMIGFFQNNKAHGDCLWALVSSWPRYLWKEWDWHDFSINCLSNIVILNAYKNLSSKHMQMSWTINFYSIKSKTIICNYCAKEVFFNLWATLLSVPLLQVDYRQKHQHLPH